MKTLNDIVGKSVWVSVWDSEKSAVWKVGKVVGATVCVSVINCVGTLS